MEATGEPNIKNKYSINEKLLPIKAHYFLYFSALGGVLPFRSIFAKHLGISATAIGVAFTILPFIKFVVNPLFGAVVDYFKKLKIVLLILVSLIAIPHLLMLSIPVYRPSEVGVYSTTAHLRCSEEELQAEYLHNYNYSCIERQMAANNVTCTGCCSSECADLADIQGTKSREKLALHLRQCSVEKCLEGILNFTATGMIPSNDSSFPFSFKDISTKKTADKFDWCFTKRTCVVSCEFHSNHCFQDLNVSEKKDESPSYVKIQFWIFLTFFLVASVSLATAISLSDTACYELLGSRLDKYGHQRMWGALGWGSGAFLGGYLNDLFSDESGLTYAPGFCMMAFILLLDVVVILKMDVKNTKYSKNIVKDVGALFAKFRVLTFVFAAFSVGILSGLLWNYQFWYLQDMGATQLLLGLVVFVECFFAELPCFMIAGKVIKKLGHMYAVTLAFFSYGFRYLGYAYIKNPWWALPLGILYGPTFGIFYAAMTSYAKNVAPPGTEATMQTILGVSFEGVGVAVGSFLGGCGFDYFGSRNTFIAAGILSFLLTVMSASIQFFVLRHKPEFRPAEEKVVSQEPVAV